VQGLLRLLLLLEGASFLRAGESEDTGHACHRRPAASRCTELLAFAALPNCFAACVPVPALRAFNPHRDILTPRSRHHRIAEHALTSSLCLRVPLRVPLSLSWLLQVAARRPQVRPPLSPRPMHAVRTRRRSWISGSQRRPRRWASTSASKPQTVSGAHAGAGAAVTATMTARVKRAIQQWVCSAHCFEGAMAMTLSF
jgi:hypothetical protein